MVHIAISVNLKTVRFVYQSASARAAFPVVLWTQLLKNANHKYAVTVGEKEPKSAMMAIV